MLTPKEHYRRAHAWSDRFDVLASWAGPFACAGQLMCFTMIGLLLWDTRAGCCALLVCWISLITQRLLLLMGKFCVWRIKVHGDALEAQRGMQTKVE